MSAENVKSPYVRIDAVAKYFDVSTASVRSWVQDGTIPADCYIKFGRTYRFLLPEVETALLNKDRPKTEQEGDSQMSLDFGESA